MERKRVVVTGVSALSPLGNGVRATWDRLICGESGIGPITLFDATGYDARIAGEVRGFVPEDFGIPFKQARRMDRFTQFAVACAVMLLKDACAIYDPEVAAEMIAEHVDPFHKAEIVDLSEIK